MVYNVAAAYAVQVVLSRTDAGLQDEAVIAATLL
jgi:hypothetical protein